MRGLLSDCEQTKFARQLTDPAEYQLQAVVSEHEIQSPWSLIHDFAQSIAVAVVKGHVSVVDLTLSLLEGYMGSSCSGLLDTSWHESDMRMPAIVLQAMELPTVLGHCLSQRRMRPFAYAARHNARSMYNTRGPCEIVSVTRQLTSLGRACAIYSSRRRGIVRSSRPRRGVVISSQTSR
jgi:hypothetical protein